MSDSKLSHDENSSDSETGQNNVEKKLPRSNSSDDNSKSATGGNKGGANAEKPPTKRIYLTNLSYKSTDQDLKTLFEKNVGEVESIELFKDEKNQPRGCGIIVFNDPKSVQKALKTLNKHEIDGREIVIKEDFGDKRDQYGRIAKNNSKASKLKDRLRHLAASGSKHFDLDGFDSYGLSKAFLSSLGIEGPLNHKVFVANLNYKVTEKKLKEVFKLAGKVQNVELYTDKEGNSRGYAVVEFDHPLEAVQAISMLDHQLFYDRRIAVRLARDSDHSGDFKLPEGLQSIGKGLGLNGIIIRNISQNTNKINPKIMEQDCARANMNGFDLSKLNSMPDQQVSTLLSMLSFLFQSLSVSK